MHSATLSKAHHRGSYRNLKKLPSNVNFRTRQVKFIENQQQLRQRRKLQMYHDLSLGQTYLIKMCFEAWTMFRALPERTSRSRLLRSIASVPVAW